MLRSTNFLEHKQGTVNEDNIDVYILSGPISGRNLRCIVSVYKSWEHVSVCGVQGLKRRTPNWEEMSFVKDTFWSEDQCVMQLHPPKKDYVNAHPHVLHLWRPINVEIPQPDVA